MNKGGFVDELAERTGFTKKDSRKALDSVIEVITEALEEGEDVMFTGFGKWETRARQATERINPQTGEKIDVPAKVAPRFSSGKTLEDTVQENLGAVETVLKYVDRMFDDLTDNLEEAGKDFTDEDEEEGA